MYDWLLETISLAKKAKTHPVNDALILSFINRPASSDQLQKHNPKGKDIWLISEFPTWCILRSQVTAADNVRMNKRNLLIQKIHKKRKKKQQQKIESRYIQNHMLFETQSIAAIELFAEQQEIDLTQKFPLPGWRHEYQYQKQT